jgi:hypothetical protein
MPSPTNECIPIPQHEMVIRGIPAINKCRPCHRASASSSSSGLHRPGPPTSGFHGLTHPHTDNDKDVAISVELTFAGLHRLGACNAIMGRDESLFRLRHRPEHEPSFCQPPDHHAAFNDDSPH